MTVKHFSSPIRAFSGGFLSFPFSSPVSFLPALFPADSLPADHHTCLPSENFSITSLLFCCSAVFSHVWLKKASTLTHKKGRYWQSTVFPIHLAGHSPPQKKLCKKMGIWLKTIDGERCLWFFFALLFTSQNKKKSVSCWPFLSAEMTRHFFFFLGPRARFSRDQSCSEIGQDTPDQSNYRWLHYIVDLKLDINTVQRLMVTKLWNCTVACIKANSGRSRRTSRKA